MAPVYQKKEKKESPLEIRIRIRIKERNHETKDSPTFPACSKTIYIQFKTVNMYSDVPKNILPILGIAILDILMSDFYTK